MRCSQCARRSLQKIKRVGQVPPLGQLSEPTRSEIWALLLLQVTCFTPGTWILGYFWGKSVCPPHPPPGSTVFGVLVRIWSVLLTAGIWRTSPGSSLRSSSLWWWTWTSGGRTRPFSSPPTSPDTSACWRASNLCVTSRRTPRNRLSVEIPHSCESSESFRCSLLCLAANLHPDHERALQPGRRLHRCASVVLSARWERRIPSKRSVPLQESWSGFWGREMECGWVSSPALFWKTRAGRAWRAVADVDAATN